jgi:amino acid adenylation domain-containing protein
MHVMMYWAAALRDAPRAIELPIAARSASPGTDRERVELVLDAAVTTALEAVARAQQVLLSDVLLAAFSALLYRYSRQDDLVVGVVGADGAAVAVRVQVNGATPYAEFVGQVRQAAAAAEQHRDVSLDALVAELGLVRTEGKHPLFDVAFTMRDDGTSRALGCELTLAVDRGTAGAKVAAEYDAARFDRESIARLLAHYQVMLAAAVADATTSVDGLPLLTEAERQQILVDWNATQTDYPRHRCLHELVEAHAERAPEAVALMLDGAELTYGELERRANQLAHHLIALGAGPEVKVGLFVERSLDMVVAILGVLKAGAAYVPLETKSPADRIAFILADAAAPVLVTQQRLAAELGEVNAKLVLLDDDAPLLARAPSTRPRTAVTTANVAYVIYTSGSTGKPKGVEVEHRHIVNLVTASGTIGSIVPSDKVLQFSSIAFDSSVEELFTPLTHGATMVLRGEEVPSARELFGERFAGVTVMNMATAYWHAFAQALKEQTLRPPAELRVVNIGGERALPEYLRQWPELAPGCLLHNQYGPTEATVMATSWRLNPAELLEGREAPIGKPLPNYTVYVLDAQGQPVPVGVNGELYIGGDSVARGYLARPELTAARFVPNPFGPGRLYRTGDLVRWRTDGNLEFISRVDDQVKIRGYRIELGEIEGVLSAMPEVGGCVVVVREDRPGVKRLVGYLAGATPVEPARVRAYLAASLPEYMIPTAFVWLDRLPITATGKVDRRALPSPDDDALNRTFTAPLGESETLLARIWSELLGVDRVGRDDNFFELGGHSLDAVRLMEKLRQLGLASDVLFSAANLAEIAASLTVHREITVPQNRIAPDARVITPADLPLIDLTQAEIDAVVATVPGGVANVQDIYALTPLQAGMLFHHQVSEEDPYLYFKAGLFPDRALVDRYLAGMQQLVDRNDPLRTAVVWDGLSTPAQVVWRHASIVVHEVELDPAGPSPREQLFAHFDPRTYRMNLGQAPLLHFGIARDPHSERWWVVELEHHMTGDHATLDIVHAEIGAFLSGRGHELPPPVPFRNYVAQTRLGPTREAHEAYFRSRLADIDEPSTPFGIVDVHQGGRTTELRQTLAPALGDRLREEARRVGVSVATLCHIAWGQVVAKTTGREQVVFGTVLFGRTTSGADATRAMGLSINTLPVRLDLDDTSIEVAAQRTHQALMALVQHEHASLPLAQRCSGVAAPAPLFSSLFNFISDAEMVVIDDHPLKDVEWKRGDEPTNYPFMMVVEVSGDKVELVANVVESIGPARMCAMMERALDQVCEALELRPSMPVRELDVLPPSERQQVLVDWNATLRADYQDDVCLHELFEAQVARTPDAIAVVAGTTVLTYQQLDARANQLAHHLRACGAGPGELVGIFLERSVEIVVALVGALKTGAAYVPLDPAYPKDRIAAIYEQARPAVLVTERALDGRLPEVGARVVRVDDDAEVIGRAPTARLPRAATRTELSHVIFTSGSTGTPKGVAIPHGVMVNYCQFSRDLHPRPELGAWLFATSVCFDMSLFEVFVPLSWGGRIHVVADLLALPSLPEDAGLTFVNAVPSVMTAYLQAGKLPSTLEAVSCAGEPLTNALVQQLRAAGVRRVYDFYGPTETFIATWALRSGTGESTIGRPIANTQIYLLDAQGMPVPIGVAGELFVGGDCLARGYFGRPDLTAERFVASPLGQGRLYRTGDLARWLPDGTLQYVGRRDHQVKIRGFRIELGEIEAVLSSHPTARDVVVVAREDIPGDKRLVAYVVGREGPPDVDALRAHVAAKVPTYMVPSAFVVLEAMPLTPNGKIDRKVLPAPEVGGGDARQAYVAPRTERESVLAGIWSQLLRVERVGVNDSFFELGGHSLLVMQLMAQVRKAFAVEVNVRTVFEAPTLGALAAVIEGTTREIAPPLVPVARDGDLEASFAQQRCWVLAQVAETDAYDMSQAVRIRGTLDAGVLAQAVDALIARHEVLRTTLAERDGRIVQRIAPARSGMLRTVDVRSYDEARRYIVELTAQPYDLTAGPLFTPVLVSIAADDHVLVLRMHHAAGDEWSIDILYRELFALYQGHALPALAVQYADFAAWQRACQAGDVEARQLAYWRERLVGATPLELPTDRPRPAVLGNRGAWIERVLPAELGRGIDALGRTHGTTPFMTYLAAFYVLLHRYTHQADLSVGTPVANRGRAETDALIGYFLNTVVLRADVSSDPSFVDLLTQVRATTLGAFAHQDVPFERVVESLRLQRDAARSPLFQVMFVHRRADDEASWTPPGLVIEDEPLLSSIDTAKFEISLFVNEGPAGLTCGIELNTELFDVATMERMLGHYQQLLASIVAEPTQRVGALPLLTEGERHQLLVEWNATSMAYPSDLCAHALVEAQADRTPDAVAVVLNTTAATYAELDRRANQLAQHLRTLGVAPGVAVGLCVERSIEMVVGILGIQKAGGAYVPLDPKYPQQRLLDVLTDAAPAAVVVDRAGMATLGTAAGPVVAVTAPEVLAAPTTRVLSGVTADDLAYVLYTSGSTGRPKGVAVPHRALVNHTVWQVAELGYAASDVFVQRTSISFDPSVGEIFNPLSIGATLVLLPPGLEGDPQGITRTLRDHAVTVAHFVPSLLRLVVDETDPPLAVDFLSCGGEALDAALVARARQHARKKFVNMYGPTETTIHATTWTAPAAPAPVPAAVPIGRPIANAQAYVLDARGALVPIGVPGELWVGGAGVAAGYYRRPELTAERFSANPFGEGRLYRTGDLVRWSSDGTIEYLGRIDHQVKLRGFRIELGEIEAVLLRHTSVREVVVVVREDVPGDKRLVAYVVPRDAGVDVDALRTHVATTLPEYMVPSAVMVLEALPLTPNKKVDRKALPAPDASVSQRAYVAPQTTIQIALAQAWSELLGVERVGVHDNFFELGGHSLLVMRLVARLRTTLGVELAVRAVFEAPTLAVLAEMIASLGSAEARSGADATRRSIASLGAAEEPALVPVARDGVLVASFGQQRFWLMAQLAEGAAYDMSHVIRLRGALDVSALARAMDALVARHEVLRTTLAEVDEVVVQRIAPARAGVLRIVERSTYADARAYCEELLARPYELSAGPLFAPALVQIATDDHLLVLRMHHAMGDEWSVEVLKAELGALYQGHALAPLAVQYADFAAWQRARMSGDALEAQLGYWRTRLAGAAPLELPTDRPRPAVLGIDGVVAERTLSVETGRAIAAVGRAQGATPFMTYLAALYALLHRYSQQTDVSIGTPVANRGRAETDALIGYFLNTVVLRADLAGSPSFAALLEQVRDVALGAYAHQEAPFEQVVEALRVPRTTGRSPLFQVMFVHQRAGEADQGSWLPAIHEEPVELGGRPTAKFELTLMVIEHADRVTCAIEANAALFDAATLDRMLGHYERLLATLAAEPGRAIDAAPLLSDAEQAQLARWSATDAVYATEACIHELFEAQVARTPDALAVVLGDASLTYAELDRRANRLAGHLRSLGVGAGQLVAISAVRSLELIVGLVGIVKAGGAYVPLDPTYPANRVRAVLDDAKPAAVVADAEGRRAVSGAATVIALDDATTWTGTGAASAVRSSDPLYVLYTSGSTGVPKGVAIAHRALVNHMTWQIGTFGFTAADRFLQRTSIAFDASGWELWAPLLVGGQMVLLPPALHADPRGIARTIATHGVTVTQFVPSLLRMVVEETDPPLRCDWVFVGGEALDAALVARARTCAKRGLVNLYGPTEVTIDSTSWTAPPAPMPVPAVVPIGKPVANTQAYVVDARGAQVPVGVPGELLLGGDQLAIGYVNRAELTAEKFIANPFGAGRLYRTGDLVRWAADGTLEYLGRIDHQVKLRGFRIELGEIEAVLARHANVREVVVVVREDVPGDKRLVAYVVGRELVDVEALRAHAATALPDYMVPAFVVLDALPLTPNGKVDRKALPAPEQTSTQRAYVAPRTDVEALLAQVWCELLGVERVGVHDEFFELGGHSLLVMRLVARLRTTLGVELPVRAVFEAPTLAALAEAIGRASGGAAPALVPVARDGALVASFGQQRFWVMAQLAEGAAYDMSQVIRLRGALDEAALGRAMDALVARHEVLRTTLTEVDEVVVQRIAPARAGMLRIVEASSYDAARAYCAELLARPYDLAAGPLFAPELVRIARLGSAEARSGADATRRSIAPDDHVLVLRMHHAVGDEWSTDLLWQELGALYQGRTLAPLAVQYADFAAWQRAWIAGDVLEQQLGYWRTRLTGAATLELPTDRPRPPVLGIDGVTVERTLPAALGRALDAVARAHAATPFMTYLAAFYALLHRYSQQEDISIGTPVANRGRAETDALIGYFLNTVVLRADLAGNPSFAGLLGQVRDVALGAYAHQDVPFEKVVDALRLPRDAGRSPLFQAMFVHRRLGEANDASWLPGISEETVELDWRQAAKFELTLVVTERADGVVCSLEANADLFEAATLARMLGHFETLLEGISAAPARAIGELPLLTTAEQQQVLVDWNATARTYPREVCLHELFEVQVDRSPDAVALVFGRAQLTYRELDARANQLAHHLRGLGVGPEVRVAICVQRSLDMIVAVLGVLKAGGAYVPIDPTYPADRIAFMLADAGAPVVVTQAALVERVAAVGTHVVALDAAGFAHAPATRPACITQPSNAAYVIYTSGSTGRPKGVVIEHGMVVNLTCGLIDTYELGPTDRMTQTVSLSFDGSVLEIFPALSAGAALVLRGETMPTADELFGEPFAGVTVMFLITAYWHTLVEQQPPQALRLVIIGGDRALPEHVRAWTARAPGCKLLNLYGPTEATVAATGTFLDGRRLLPGREVPIGGPLANYRAYVLDRHGQPVPVGVPGELFIGGDGVGRGYLGREELTQERFVASPFGRLYRTGDLVRWFADGTLEYMGRIDQQVKVRGFRIELGEIETAVAAHPAVREVVVVARDEAPGSKRLVAYVVGRDGRVDVDALRAHVAAGLPDYMVPSAFVVLEALPLTPNGKVDRKALPAPDATAEPQAFAVPWTPTEIALAEIFGRLLGIARVSATADFFELGGHSLLAIQVVTKVRERLGVNVAVAALFQARTLDAFARMVDELGPTASARQLVSLRPAVANTPSVVAVHPVEGVVDAYLALADAGARVRGFDAFEARGLFGEPASTSIPEMAAAYARELIATRGTRPVHLLGWSFGGLVAYELRQQLAAAGVEVLSTTMLDTWPTTLLERDDRDPAIAAQEIVAERARAIGRVAVDDGSLATYARVIEAHVRAMHSYVAAPTTERILIVNAEASLRHAERNEAWRRLAPNLEIHTSPGTHHSMLARANVDSLHALLSKLWR